jgi:TnpA family transposase
LRAHPDYIRYALLASFVHLRIGDITDDIIKMFMDMIHRMDVQSEEELDRRLLSDLKKVEGKVQMLFRIAHAVVGAPDGTVREVIFPEVKEEYFRELVAEYEATGARFRTQQQKLMQRKWAHHYRRMLPLVLGNLTFRSNNHYQPIIDALGMIKKHMQSDLEYFPESVPIEGVVSPSWEKSVIHNVNGEKKVNRKMYELCTLQKAEKGLKCRELWEERAREYRNPDQDMPPQWHEPENRTACYVSLSQPVEATAFVETERSLMTEALKEFNKSLPDNAHVRITGRQSNQGRGLFAVDKLVAQQEPENLTLIKQAIKKQYGMIELLDVMVEVDKLTNFTDMFTHSGTKEIRSREKLRPLLLLGLFAEATNTGIARVAKANDRYSYDEMYYVRRNYIWRDPLRNANVAVVNRIFQIRNPKLWGEGHACASDGKSFQSWNRNLLSEWRTRYKGHGVMAYWHVEKNSVCIYSQLKGYSPSEVAAMIEGLIRHDTEMRVEKNFVDSHGQSEVAFAFARLLNTFKLVPRLKRIKNERLYLPGKGMAGDFPNLAGVLTRPIRWDLIEHQYDEMVKATIAMRDGHASAEAILHRFNSYNRQHPTYKALIELGKAEKSIFLTGWLSSLEVRRETHEGLNVVENWNSATEFVSYGRHGELATNDTEDQEIKVLSLQLLQNCIMLVNTILVQRILEDDALLSRLTPADLRGLTPLFYGHINPYGLFYLDIEQPSFLEAA